jgi:hypothetical protein
MFVAFDGFTATYRARGVDGHIAGTRLGMN